MEKVNSISDIIFKEDTIGLYFYADNNKLAVVLIKKSLNPPVYSV
jgi:hypothetical protein